MYGEKTIIIDGMGHFCDGRLVTEEKCLGCPYVVSDIKERMACYADDFEGEICKNGKEFK